MYISFTLPVGLSFSFSASNGIEMTQTRFALYLKRSFPGVWVCRKPVPFDGGKALMQVAPRQPQQPRELVLQLSSH